MFAMLFVFCVLLFKYNEASNRIIGGNAVPISSVPFQLALHHGKWFCGAVLIKRNVALTAAHCVFIPVPEHNTTVYGGSTHYISNYKREVTSILIHPDFNPPDIQNDIAVLKLEENFPITKKINYIKLPRSDPPAGAHVTVSGWGSTKEGEVMSKTLYMVKLEIIEQSLCQFILSAAGKVTETMICAGSNEEPKDACGGDSGGPLVHDQRLIGIVSWGDGCGIPGNPGVYTRVLSYKKFIVGSIKTFLIN